MVRRTKSPRLQVMHAPLATAVQRLRAETAGGRLHGRALVLARTAWLAVAALTVALYVADVWTWIVRMRGSCVPRVCVDGYVPQAVQRAFAALHLSISFHSWYDLGMNVLFAAGFAAIAALLFWRRSHDLPVLFVSLALLLFGVGSFEGGFLAAGLPAVSHGWRLPVAILGLLGELAFGIFVLIFPDGRFVPRWTRLAVTLLLLWWVPTYFFPGSPLDFTTWPGVMYFGGWAVLLSIMGGTQVYRYRRVSTPRQRLQTKWVVYGFVGAGIGYFAGQLVVYFLAPALTSPRAILADLAGYTLAYAGILLVPICIAIAMLRHHLFDIDVIIRRTLIYGTLTAALALVYVVGVVALHAVVQALLGGLAGQAQTTPLALVGSTLASVALFEPLRHHIQTFIDRRFYRRKYNAARTLDAFGASLRTETNLEDVQALVLSVVDETMQPEHVSLWLRAAKKAEDWDLQRAVSEDVMTLRSAPSNGFAACGLPLPDPTMPPSAHPTVSLSTARLP